MASRPSSARPSSLRRRLATVLALVCLALVIPATPVLASEEPAIEPLLALGHEGELYRLRVGNFGELFPDDAGDTPHVRVMALEIEHPSSAEDEARTERLLVPGTETWRPERAPRMVVDEISGAVLLVWQAGTPGGSSTLHFTSYRKGEWQEVDQVRAANASYVFDRDPTVLTSKDRLDLELDESTTLTIGRTLFHLLWIEEGSQSVRYAPILFVDGRPSGWTEILTLTSALAKTHEGETPADGSLPMLLDAAVIDSGHALSVTLSEKFFGRLGVLRLAVRPPQLDLLGDEIIAEILAADPDLSSERLRGLIEKLAGRMIIIGAKMRLNPAITDYVTHDVSQWLSENGEGFAGDLEGLGAAARARALDAGALVYGRMIVDPTLLESEIPEIDLIDFLDSNGHRSQLEALIRLEVVADFEAPPMGEGASVYASERGDGMLVAWPTEGAVSYRENRGQGWTAVHRLPVSDALGATEAHALLREKIR